MADEAVGDAGCFVYQPRIEDSAGLVNDATGSRSTATTTNAPAISPQRLEAYLQVWQPTQSTLDSVLASADAGSVQQICTWLSGLLPQTLDRIPTGLVTTSTASSLVHRVTATIDPEDTLLISIPAAQCSSLKSALKCIMSATVLAGKSKGEVDKSSNIADDGTRLLSYDLEILRRFIDGQRFERVLLYFSNGESLHGGVLSDLIDVLEAWRDRIPFACIFETAVGIELFQEKLTRRALAALRGEPFSTASAGDVVESVFRAAAVSRDQRLWMGANPADMLLERQAEHLQSAQAFVNSIKYMYMIHFYRNPLSVLLVEDGAALEETDDLLDAAVKVKSLQAYIAELKTQKKAKEANKLLRDGKALGRLITESLITGRQNLHDLSDAVQVLSCIHETAQHGNNSTLLWSSLYVQAMSGQLAESPTLQALLMSVRVMTSDILESLLSRLIDLKVPEAASFKTQLATVVESHSAEGQGPLHSEHDKAHETTRATVVAKKISLSRQKTALSKGDSEYSTLLKQVSSALQEYLKQRLINPKTLLFNELFIFDLRVPLREAFAPRPRYALEHALTVPGAYLACECCDPDERGLSGLQPATSVLYQLYLESGITVNIADLWAAFDAIMPSFSQTDDGDDTTMDVDNAIDDQKLALFYQALAELKYLGMIKSSRKKADHFIKLRFRGL